MPLPLQIKAMVTNTMVVAITVSAMVTKLSSRPFNIQNRVNFQVSEFRNRRFPDFLTNFPDFHIHSGSLENWSKTIWKSGKLLRKDLEIWKSKLQQLHTKQIPCRDFQIRRFPDFKGLTCQISRFILEI